MSTRAKYVADCTSWSSQLGSSSSFAGAASEPGPAPLDGGMLYRLPIGGTAGEGGAVGQAGLALSTPDGGRSWQRLESLGETNLLGVWQSGPRAFAVGIRGAYASHDGGRSWKSVNRSDIETGWYQAVASSAARDKPVLVGHRGRILEMDE